MPREQVAEVRERLMEIYKAKTNPPECFVAQMAFTSLNSFLLTTDGRLFSWGAVSYCLGRSISATDSAKQKGDKAGGIPLFQNKKQADKIQHKQSVDIGEI